MSRNAKIIVGVVAGLLLLCVCGAVATFSLLGTAGMALVRTVQTDSVGVADNASKIADFTLPAGYRPEATISIEGFTFVSYAPGDGRSHIMLVQAPESANVDQALLEQYAQKAGQNQSYGNYSALKTVGQTTVTIRGQSVTMVIGEGTNRDGQAFRTLTGAFQGKGGPAFLSIESPIRSWNQSEVDAFIASIR